MIGLHINQLGFSYSGSRLFFGVNIKAGAGEWISVLGRSGIGKTSLLRCCAGLLKQGMEGTVSAADGSPLTGRVAYMAQNDLLLPWLSVEQNVNLANRLKFRRGHDQQQVHQIIDDVGLSEASSSLPHQLSGGMRQRTALARTLLQGKPVNLLDEPFSALDAITRFQLQNLAAETLGAHTVLMVTHDPLEAIRLSHRIYVLNGRPATLSTVVEPEGSPPRQVNDGDNARLYTEIMERLAA